MIDCPKCGEDMPKLRLTKFGYEYCINCSTEKPKRAINVTGGSGDHTYNTIEVVTSDQYDSYQRQQELNEKIKLGNAES
tara:strand:+ start:631 stop:867 length:237 start_codon:yes stop_codon:yes gene_type:complete